MGSWQTSVVKSDTLLFLPKIRCPGAAFHRTGAFQCSLRCRMESAPSAHEVGSSNTGRYEKPVHRDAVNRFLSGVDRKDAGAKSCAARVCGLLRLDFPFCNSNPQHLVMTDE